MLHAEAATCGATVFVVEFDAVPGAPLARVRNLESALEDYDDVHDFDIGGTRLKFAVQAQGRCTSLSRTRCYWCTGSVTAPGHCASAVARCGGRE
jgi:hypothetical protein